MKDKEMIEEMAKEKCKHFTKSVCYKIDCKTQCRYYGKANCHNCSHKSICTYFENCDCEQEVKEYGCKHYQPKIDKDSVVLSREEYDSCQKLITELTIESCKARKETAEKFLQLAYDRCLEKSFIKKVEELAKSLGVEIKEN